MSTNYVNGYLMSFNTYLLQPIQHESKIFTRVIDKHNELIVTRKPLHVYESHAFHWAQRMKQQNFLRNVFLAININCQLLLHMIMAFLAFFCQPIRQTLYIIFGLDFMPFQIFHQATLVVLLR
ncbi:hypothetical protein LSPH24S_05661 [Lysinibacillus sphaericus]